MGTGFSIDDESFFNRVTKHTSNGKHNGGVVETRLPPIMMHDDLNALARLIRMLNQPLIIKFQAEIYNILPEQMPWAKKQLLVRRLVATLVLWALQKWEEEIASSNLLANVSDDLGLAGFREHAGTTTPPLTS